MRSIPPHSSFLSPIVSLLSSLYPASAFLFPARVAQMITKTIKIRNSTMTRNILRAAEKKVTREARRGG